MENVFYKDENLIHVTNEIITILDMEDGVIMLQVCIWFSHKIRFQSYFCQSNLFDNNKSCKRKLNSVLKTLRNDKNKKTNHLKKV